ncbi:ABC transporter ATP-binding protein [Herminiimonas contaminans]|uniref:ABC transporter ATP-binding protein n=1 Tax=Herminiimonas contaminans TaxID=1111140 RepID=A0ABS0ETP5_9BURK|nr:ABC transporter ATP-binding protein [Herminiimonas contaminans]MBF8178215.1 ABC transporter ATP-binding protein [Herminiimonas contaminans]
MSELLRFHNVSAGYGDSIVLENVSISLETGGSLALLGRNGVGKTTLIMTLMGLTKLHSGEVFWQGKNISSTSTYKRSLAGLGWVPQERHMFPSLTVEEHLTVVARPGKWDLQKIYGIFPRLKERRANMGNQLSGGEQQMVAIARALMTNPSLLLLDEPMEGLAPIIVQDLMQIIKGLVTDEGLAVIIVEQHARLALALTKNMIALDRGKVIYESESASLLADSALLNRLVSVS